MKELEFVVWARSRGVDEELISALLRMIAESKDPNEMIYSLEGIKQMNEDEEYPVEAAAVRAGFFVIGSCINGDPVVMDLKQNPGSIHFASHEDLDEGKALLTQVADSLEEFAQLMAQDELPIDYFEAIDRN